MVNFNEKKNFRSIFSLSFLMLLVKTKRKEAFLKMFNKYENDLRKVYEEADDVSVLEQIRAIIVYRDEVINSLSI